MLNAALDLRGKFGDPNLATLPSSPNHVKKDLRDIRILGPGQVKAASYESLCGKTLWHGDEVSSLLLAQVGISVTSRIHLEHNSFSAVPCLVQGASQRQVQGAAVLS